MFVCVCVSELLSASNTYILDRAELLVLHDLTCFQLVFNFVVTFAVNHSNEALSYTYVNNH